jgi:hypothetical protein
MIGDALPHATMPHCATNVQGMASELARGGGVRRTLRKEKACLGQAETKCSKGGGSKFYSHNSGSPSQRPPLAFSPPFTLLSTAPSSRFPAFVPVSRRLPLPLVSTSVSPNFDSTNKRGV